MEGSGGALTGVNAVLEAGLSFVGVGVGASGARASGGLDGLRLLWVRGFFGPMIIMSEGEANAD